MIRWSTYTIGLLIIAILSLMAYSCANVGGSLTGGPRDTTPPEIDTTKSTPNYSTRFSERKIEIYFDEFITANNLITKTLISPPLLYIPKMEARGKKLTIEINDEEELKTNATYIFNFGDAIGDYRENNKIENFNFVFSTGDIIDSLGMSGRVYDAFSGSPVSEIYVMLYDDTRDSVVYQDKPFYFAITDKEGVFKFQNLRSDTFKLFTLKDANLNYIYDQESEIIGYSDTLIILKDSIITGLEIEAFLEGSTLRFLKVESVTDGLIKLAFNEPLEEIPAYQLGPQIEVVDEIIKKDTLLLLYKIGSDSTNLIIDDDTILIRPSFTNRFLQDSVKALVSSRRGAIPVAPSDSFKLSFSYPISYLDSSKIRSMDTSGVMVPLTWGISEGMLVTTSTLPANSPINVTISPGAMLDIYGRTHDTIKVGFVVQPKEKYGDIRMTMVGLDTAYSYIVSLIQSNNIVSKRIVRMDSSILFFNVLPPGEYSVEVLEDRNGNGRWDSGSYILKSKSEKRKIFNLEPLRENWELEAKINWIEEQPTEVGKN